MSHTYTLNLLHVVCSTKNRATLIRNLDSLITNLRGIARNKNISVYRQARGTSLEANV